jgi:hypothetical protein
VLPLPLGSAPDAPPIVPEQAPENRNNRAKDELAQALAQVERPFIETS